MIERLRQFQIGQYIREEGPQSHLKKGGTPTMGGVLICIAMLVPTLLWAIFQTRLCGWRCSRRWRLGRSGLPTTTSRWCSKRNLGLTAAEVVLQFMASAAVAVVLLVLRARGDVIRRG